MFCYFFGIFILSSGQAGFSDPSCSLHWWRPLLVRCGSRPVGSVVFAAPSSSLQCAGTHKRSSVSTHRYMADACLCGWGAVIVLAIHFSSFTCIDFNEMESVLLSVFVLHASALLSLRRTSWSLSRLLSLTTPSNRTCWPCSTCSQRTRTWCQVGLHLIMRRKYVPQSSFL